MASYVANSRIRYGATVEKGEAGMPGTITGHKDILPGDKVDQKTVGVDDGTWDRWIRDQVIVDENNLPGDIKVKDLVASRVPLNRAVVAEIRAMGDAATRPGRARQRQEPVASGIEPGTGPSSSSSPK